MCQMLKDVKYQIVKQLNYIEEVHKKLNWHNEVHTCSHQFWCHRWRSLKLVKNIFCEHLEGFWQPSYVTSKLMSLCVNLIVSRYFLWTSSIVKLYISLFDAQHIHVSSLVVDVFREFSKYIDQICEYLSGGCCGWIYCTYYCLKVVTLDGINQFIWFHFKILKFCEK